MNAVKQVLHVGCGPRSANALPEMFQGGQWREIRLDIDPGVQPDYVADICDMGVIPSARRNPSTRPSAGEEYILIRVPPAAGPSRVECMQTNIHVPE